MKSSVAATPLAQVETPLLAIAVPQSTSLPASLADLDRAAGGVLARALGAGDYKGKRDETLLVYGSGKAQRILLVGVGKAGEVTRSALRRAAAVGAKRARTIGATAFAFAIAVEARGGVSATEVGQVVVEGAAHGGWQFTELKQAGDDPKPELEAVAVVVDPADASAAETGRSIGDAIAAGHRLTRGLQMQPGNVCTPTYLADQAAQLANTYGFTLTVLDRAQLKKEGMGALLAVAQGSAEEPRFIALEYKGGGTQAPVVLVGKGVTFDSGGISIKPAQNMEDMKFDMSGAAAVLGTFDALGRLKPKLNVVGLIPSTENLPSGPR